LKNRVSINSTTVQMRLISHLYKKKLYFTNVGMLNFEGPHFSSMYTEIVIPVSDFLFIE